MRMECRKLILRRETLILFLLSIGVLFILTMQTDPGDRMLKKQYRSVIARYRMPFTEAADALYNELEGLGDLPADQESEAYCRWIAVSNLLSSTKRYTEHNEEMIRILGELQATAENADTEYIQRDARKAYQAYNRAYEYHPCNFNDMNLGVWNLEDAEFRYLFLLVAGALLCNLFTLESETGMYQLLYSSKRGKPGLFVRKIGAAFLFLVPISFVFTAFPFVGLWLRRGLSFYLLWEPMQSMDAFALCPFSLTLGEYLLLSWGMHLLVGILLVSLIALSSVFLKRGLSVFGVTGAVMLGTALLGASEQAPLLAYQVRKFGGCSLLNLQTYLTAYDTVNVLGYPVTRFYLAAAFTLVLSAALLLLAYILYIWKHSARHPQKKRRA